ncbi:hypothetical protein FE783_09040 [Paenibacillus mesophilus]|nr:hypothetical protein FE783_09040 [Paenibacillus mesophilus]
MATVSPVTLIVTSVYLLKAAFSLSASTIPSAASITSETSPDCPGPLVPPPPVPPPVEPPLLLPPLPGPPLPPPSPPPPSPSLGSGDSRYRSPVTSLEPYLK